MIISLLLSDIIQKVISDPSLTNHDQGLKLDLFTKEPSRKIIVGSRLVLKIFDVMQVCSNVRTCSLPLEAKDRDKNCLFNLWGADLSSSLSHSPAIAVILSNYGLVDNGKEQSYLALHILQSHFKWLCESRISSNVSGQVRTHDKARNKNFLSILLALNLMLSCSCFYNWHKKLNFIGKNAYLHDHKSIRVTCQMPYKYVLQCAVSAYYSEGYFAPLTACLRAICWKGQMCVLRTKDPGWDTRIR